jgi:hypothetical protein
VIRCPLRNAFAAEGSYIDTDARRPFHGVGMANDPYLALLIVIAIISTLWEFFVKVPRNL